MSITVAKVTFKQIAYGSDEYKTSVALREEITQKPLGLSFASEELDQPDDWELLIRLSQQIDITRS